MESIQVSRHRHDIVIVPPKPREFLPAIDLRAEVYPVRGEFLVAPMYLGSVAGDAMCRVQQLAACRVAHWLRGIREIAEQDEQHDEYRFPQHVIFRKHPYLVSIGLARFLQEMGSAERGEK